MPVFPQAASITHAHILACANTELRRQHPSGDAPLRVLDAGCGNGQLLAYLFASLADLNPRWTLELYGYDVNDHGVQAPGFLFDCVERLSDFYPMVDWQSRVRQIGFDDPWPFDDDYFDLIVSNQVLEHVNDHDRFFREAARTLKPGGSSIHLFPLRHCLWEGHLLLPLVHRVYAHDAREQYISILSRMGMGKFRAQRRRDGVSLAGFSERHADYMNYWTNYQSEREMLCAVTKSGLRASFRYTPEFYLQKARDLCGLPMTTLYRDSRRGLWDSAAVKAFRYMSSVTLTIEKINKY